MKIGFTGTRKGCTKQQLDKLSQLLEEVKIYAGKHVEFLHGDCVGADAEIAGLAKTAGFKVIGFLPINDSKRAFFPSDEERIPKEYLERNHDIVTESDVMFACPKNYGCANLRGEGTWATIKYCQKVGRRLLIIFPDGSIVCEK